MKDRLKDYVEMIFADAPDCAKAKELKEEMYANVADKYDDLISEGKSPSAAYNICVASVGDISELIDSLKREQSEFAAFDYAEESEPRSYTAAEMKEIEEYQRKSGIMTAISVALYILCWVPTVILSPIFEYMGAGSDLGETVGVVVMMVLIAVATSLMILKSYIRPVFMKGDENDESKKEKKTEAKTKVKVEKHKNPIMKAISSCIWGVAFISFILLGTLGGLWHPGWLVFLIATAVDNIVEAIFEINGKKYL